MKCIAGSGHKTCQLWYAVNVLKEYAVNPRQPILCRMLICSGCHMQSKYLQPIWPAWDAERGIRPSSSLPVNLAVIPTTDIVWVACTVKRIWEWVSCRNPRRPEGMDPAVLVWLHASIWLAESSEKRQDVPMACFYVSGCLNIWNGSPWLNQHSLAARPSLPFPIHPIQEFVLRSIMIKPFNVSD